MKTLLPPILGLGFMACCSLAWPETPPVDLVLIAMVVMIWGRLVLGDMEVEG